MGYPRTRAFADSYAVQLGRFTPGSFWPEQEQTYHYVTTVLFNFDRLGPWLPLYAAGFVAADRRSWPSWLGGILVLIGAVRAIAIGHCFWEHYFVMGIGALALLAAVSCLSLASASPGWRMQLALGAMLGLGLLPRIQPRYEADAKASFAPGVPNVPPAVIDYITRNTAPDDYILATQPGLYFFAQRKSALTYNSFLDEVIGTYPGSTDEERLARLLAQIRAHRPKIIYVYPELAARMVRHSQAVIQPLLQEGKYEQVQDHLYRLPSDSR
jgi:hypothetical protein